MDAYPEKGRVPSSRVFFMCNNICVLGLHIGMFFGVIVGVRNMEFDLPGGWSFGISELASSAIGSLLPFGVKNSAVGVINPRSLAVVQSDVVSVKLDPSTAKVLTEAHSCLGLVNDQHTPSSLFAGLVVGISTAV